MANVRTNNAIRVVHRVAMLFVLGCCIGITPAFAAPQWPKDVASYHIKAELKPKLKRVDAELVLRWNNPSQVAVKELRFHLYMNAFRNEKSTFFRELRKLGRFGAFGYRVPLGRWGWCKILSMKDKAGTELAQKAKFIAPDDGNKDDRTVLQLPLQQPVPPGGSIQLKIRFQTKLPWAMVRVGYRKNYYFIGQWFPKVAVFEPKGVRGAKQARWNSHQFHAMSEFYADFGSYHVELTVPKKYIVGATGERVAVKSNASKGTKTYTYKQPHVHDFAWTAYPHYRRIVRTFDPKKDVSAKELAQWSKRLGVPAKQLTLRPVKMVFMMQPSHMHQLKRHADALRNALKIYGLWLGAYPYKTITLVDPAYEGKIRGFTGMEYATLFTVGTKNNIAKKDRSLEWLIFHEYGHMYFQGMLASNEFEEPWLDEGVNTYSNVKLLQWLYPDDVRVPRFAHTPLDFIGIPIHRDHFPRLAYLFLNAKEDPVAQPAWAFKSGASYGQQAYMKCALVLMNLEKILGQKTMLRGMRDYYQKWQFKHPGGNDFKRHFQQYTKQDLSSFFNQFLHKTKILDYAVGRISSRRITPARGVFRPLLPKPAARKPAKPAAKTKAPLKRDSPLKPTPGTQPASKPAAQKGATPPPTKKTVKAKKKQTKKGKAKKAKKENKYRSQVIIERKGSAIWPVEAKLVFADGTSLMKRWDGKGLWIRYVVDSPSRLTHVEIDPQRKLTLDVNITNNSRTIKSSNKAATGWFLKLMAWIQHILLSLILAL